MNFIKEKEKHFLNVVFQLRNKKYNIVTLVPCHCILHIDIIILYTNNVHYIDLTMVVKHTY